MEDFDDLLTGVTLEHLLAHGFVFNASNKLLGDSEVNVGLEQGQANFAKGVGHVLFADATMPAEIFEDLLKFVRKARNIMVMGQRARIPFRETEPSLDGASYTRDSRGINGRQPFLRPDRCSREQAAR